MAEANQAYERGDATRLRQILEEYECCPEAVLGEGIGAELVRVIRKIGQVKTRLAQIESERERLSASELSQLRDKATDLKQQGRDLLCELAGNVQEQIKQARERLTVLEAE
jgi:signal transduction protein with GAF and PtsI domain